MSEDRVRNAFGDVNRQARDADPERSLAALAKGEQRTRSARPWTSAVAAAAVVIAAVGSVVVLTRGSGGDDLATTTDGSAVTTTTLDESLGTVASAAPAETPGITDGTVVAAEPTTTTTDPLEGRDPVFAGEGWRVVGVDADDVLNVRSRPGTEGDIVSTFAHDETNVALAGGGTTLPDGSEWWAVVLADGGVGWVNTAFLAPPESWTGDVRAEQCGVEDTPDFGQDGPPPDPGDQPNAVMGVAHVDAGDCDRYIFVLGNWDGETYQPVASFNAQNVRVSAGRGVDGVAVTLPPTVVEAVQVATNVRVEGRPVLLTTPRWDADGFLSTMRVLGNHDAYGLSFRVNPARIILDVIDSSGEALDVIDGAGTFLFPPIVNGPIAQVDFRGYARPFEGVGNLRIVPISGSIENAVFSGPSVIFDDGGGDGAFNASWLPGYGEFVGWLDGLTTGTYELWVYQSECLENDTPAALAECGVSTTINIP